MTVTDVAPADFAADRAAVARALDDVATRCLGAAPGRVAEAIRYSLEGEGKRLRAILVMAAHRAAGGTRDVSALAAAVEVVHAYSLVHDDLPCMDDDDVRRGRPTVHKAFGIPTATAAGLAMVPLAARAAGEAAAALGLPLAIQGEIVRTLMHAAGATGMIGGQLLDLEGEGTALDLAQLERIHRSKTGALIIAAMRLGGLSAMAPAPLLDALAGFGASVGLAFQIADDVLDVTATTDELGKTAGKDAQDRKSTYPALLGVEGARSRAAALVREGCAALQAHGALTPELESVARFIVERRS
jgi:farnesyl diphosphate synthase/geranylgeranyl diphosphate synthase type II